MALSFRPIQEVGRDDVAALYGFYRRTIWEKGAQAYLTEAFFAGLHAQGNDRVYVAMAHDAGTAVAAALFFAPATSSTAATGAQACSSTPCISSSATTCPSTGL